MPSPFNGSNPRTFDGFDQASPWPTPWKFGQGQTQPTPISDDVEIMIDGAGPDLSQPTYDPVTGTMAVEAGDGSVVIDLAPDMRQQSEFEDFDENIAEQLDPIELSSISNYLLQGIDDDEDSRSEWLTMRADGLDLLGNKLQQPKSDVGGSAAPVQNQSTVRHPMLNEAVMRFQANAYAELCPANGPAKVVNYSDQTLVNDEIAQALERDLNYYLTTTADEYYDGTQKMLWWVGYAGTMFKKVYWHPIERRPVSEMVDAKDLIVSNEATNLESAGRVTQRIIMRPSIMRRMQLLGIYLDVDIAPQTIVPDAVERKIGDMQGIDPQRYRTQDADYELYECYCELDIPGFEHTDDDGEETGLPLPYRVTIDKNTRQILEVRRNWEDGDEMNEAKIPYIEFSYVRGPGFYGVGLLQILGNTTVAATAGWRLMLDAGMFACFPGFLYAKQGNRQLTNEFRVPPGGGLPLDIGNLKLQDAVMPLPYKEPSPALMQLIENIAATGQRVGNTAETPVGEGVQNAPVGTTLALIEQNTKIEAAVHKGLHRSQGKELRQLVELFRQEPEALWRKNKRCAMKRNKANTLNALSNCDIVPQSDPNVPSRSHRMAKVAALIQIVEMVPTVFDQTQVALRALREIGINDAETLLVPPTQAQPDPLALAQLQLKARDLNIKELKTITDIQSKNREMQQKKNLQILEIAERIATHPESLPQVEQVLAGFGSPVGT